MRKLINFLIVIFLLLILCNCSTMNNKNITNDIMYGDSMIYDLYIEKATLYQVDSIINADTLPTLDLWFLTTFVDFQTNERILKRLCIKQNNKIENVYVVIGNKEPYKIEKRIRK